jgi:hypothetical protein
MTIKIVRVRVAAGADDGYGESVTTAWDITADFLWCGDVGGAVSEHAWARFLGIAVPRNAPIVHAYLDYIGYDTLSAAAVKSTIKAEAADNPTQITTYADFVARTRTARYVRWDSIPSITANAPVRSPDIRHVIQEIVNRVGWTPGNAISLFHENDGSTASANRTLYSYNGSPTKAALLHIEYDDGQGGVAIVTVHDDSPPYTMLAEFRTAHDVNRLLVHSPADKGAGAFDFAISATDPQANRDTVKSGLVVVIRSTHPGCPAFVGRIDLIEHDPDAGIVKISGAAYDQVLFERVLPQDCVFESQAAGSIAAQLLRLANSRNPTGVWPDTSPGTPIQGQFDAGSAMLGDALNDLAGKTGDEWWLDYRVSRQKLEITLRWGPKRGEDRTSEIVLREGKDFATATYTEDGLGSAKSAVAVGGGATLADRPAAAVSRQAASATGKAPTVGAPSEAFSRGSAPLGVTLSREVALYFPLDSDEAVLARTAQRMLEVPDNAAEAFTLVLSPLAPWDIQPGDVVRAVFPSVDFGGVERNVRILSIQPAEVTGERDIAVSVEYA